MLYELQTLMVPTVNLTDAADNFPRGYEGLARIPWRGPGCTGIIALNSMDNSVYHARNLDFSPKDIMAKLVYNGIFMKGGVEVFRSQMVAGYACVITGAVFGKDVDGYALERNTRYPDHQGGYEETLSQLAGGAELNGWQLRKILETEGSYNGAVQVKAYTRNNMVLGKLPNIDEEVEKKVLCSLGMQVFFLSARHRAMYV